MFFYFYIIIIPCFWPFFPQHTSQQRLNNHKSFLIVTKLLIQRRYIIRHVFFQFFFLLDFGKLDEKPLTFSTRILNIYINSNLVFLFFFYDLRNCKPNNTRNCSTVFYYIIYKHMYRFFECKLL